MHEVEVAVVGAGQAGLSTGYHLKRRGTDFVVLDANDGPGGAWRHRWASLTLGNTHRLHDLPGLPLGDTQSALPAAQVVARYFGTYETTFQLPVRRPVQVRSVTSPDGPNGHLRLHTDAGVWQSSRLINATGTWDSPHWPHYPGRELFRGRQLHTHDFVSAEEFGHQHVVVVGGGTSAVQFLLQLALAGATTTWVTRQPVGFTTEPFDAEWGRRVEERVTERVRQGLAPLSVVAETGLYLSDEYRRGVESGVLADHRMFSEITRTGVKYPDGTEESADVILWATGFRASLNHLAPLGLRESGGGIRLDGATVVRDPRVQLVGYGSSASTLGATRAGRLAARLVG